VKSWLIDISYGNKKRERFFCFAENKPIVEVKELELTTEIAVNSSLVVVDEYEGGAK